MASSQPASLTDVRDSTLEIDDESLRALSQSFADLVAGYLAGIRDRRIFPDTSGVAIANQFAADPPLESEPLARIISDCDRLIANSRHNGHPRFFGYVASPSTPIGAFADLLASALDAAVTSWRSAPAPTEVERTVVQWLGSLIGFDEKAQGLLTSGGSMANLIAVFIAQRARTDFDIAQKGLRGTTTPVILYASDQVHLSITKAVDILGLGKENVRLLPADNDFRFDVRELRSAIQQDRESGLKPFCVVGSAGTAATGAVDPLTELAEIARENDLWFHVDGAYGAPAAMVDHCRQMFAGMEFADSVSLDPHKWLYTPIDCGCLLVHDFNAARRAFASDADYIKVHEIDETETFAFWDYGPELSRRFRALKVWLTLKYYGAIRLAAAIGDDIRLAQYMAERVAADPDLELLAPVQLSICCFRYVPQRLRANLDRDDVASELDRINERIMHRVQRGGRAYLSNAKLHGRFALRACIINFRTTRADIDLTLDTVREAARELEAEDGSK